MTFNIKICGVKTLEAVRTATESGAAFVGLVFYPKSPRYLSPLAVDALVSEIQELPQRPKLVGLFVNVPMAELAQSAERYRLDYLQLSGDETPEAVIEATRLCPVLKSLRLPEGIAVEAAIQEVAAYAEIPGVTLLLDAAKQGYYGGTGETGNWQVARAVAECYPVLLAGGLNPANVAEAVRLVRPWGVDVSSGVESAPGEKDLIKIRQFCEAARGTQMNTD
jgi:phosphoribosylanthranilate isomerase